MGGINKKATVAAVASILLVAAVVAVVVGSTKRASQEASTGSTSRAVKGICSPTDYKETCEKSLAGANSSDPKELVKLAIDVTVTNIQQVLQRSALLKEAATDPGTKDAYAVCEEVLQNAVDDLKRSVEKVGEFSIVKLGEYMEDLKTWLSAVITNQETCVDAFENSSGDAGEKMKSLLKVAKELSSNGLAMVSELSSMFTTFTFGSRKMFPSSTTPALAAAPALPPTPPAQAPATPSGADQSTPAAAAAPPTPTAPVAAAAAPVVTAPPPAFAEKRLPVGGAASLKPNIVVAQDGSGQFKTVSEAVSSLPTGNNPVVIFVKAGLYDEIVSIPKGVNMVTLVGEGPLKTRITGNKNFAAGVKTYHTATVAVNSEDFLAMDIAFENTAGAEGHQAVALRVSGDRAVFYNVAIDGYQDTLYAHNYRQYYRDCSVSGTIDFVFGDSLSIFQNCTFIVRKPAPNQACMVTAQGRIDPRSQGSFVIQNCNITAEPAFVEAQPPHKAYLGRPWKELSRTIIMYSNIEGSIAPEGWSPWAGNFALDTCYYAEFENKGAGADTANRVQWAGIKKITLEEAQSWTGGVVYGGDAWITEAGVPYVPTLY